MADTAAVNLILLKLKEVITAQMQTAIPTTDLTYVDNVKLGLLFEEKLTKNIQIGINSGDHSKPEELDGIVTLDTLPDIGMMNPAREIGGGQIWMRRGVAQLECFYIREKLSEEAAFANAHVVMSRLQQAIESVAVTAIARDSFGERPFGQIYCYASSYFESGGPPSSYIFRGKALWSVFTEKQ